MNPFTVETPRAIHFGAGAIEKIGALTSALGRKALLVTGNKWLSSSSWGKRLERLLSGIEVRTVGCPAGEPSTRSLARVIAEAGPFAPEVIIAVGGGAVIDTAKALSALLRHGGPVERFLEGVEGSIPVPGPCIPWIAVPTTAGTGAEVTKNSVIRAEALAVKKSMRSPFLLATAVIVDPQLTVTLPLSVTGISGLDALTQLVEAYVTKKRNLFVRSLVEGAFGPMLKALQGLPRALDDVELRTSASYGALVSGIALANAGLGAAHGFASGLGGLFEVPHGLICAVTLPYVLEANAEVIEKDIDRLTSDFREQATGGLDGGVGRSGTGSGRQSGVAWLSAQVCEILAAFGLPADLRGFHIPAERMREIAERSSGSSMSGNPRDLGIDEREKILAKII